MSFPPNPEELDPGIRSTVMALVEAGFNTADSGDGVTKFQEGGWSELDLIDKPHVMIMSTRDQLIEECDRLSKFLFSKGIEVNPLNYDENAPSIQATYDPTNQSAIIVMMNIIIPSNIIIP